MSEILTRSKKDVNGNFYEEIGKDEMIDETICEDT